MQTSDLIERLAAELHPLPARAALRRMVAGLLGGGLFALGGVLLILGTDFPEAVLNPALWMKWAYAFAVSAIALWLCLRLARPERTSGSLLLALAAPLLALGIIAVGELAAAPSGERLHLWLGKSAPICPWIIAALAIPLFVGILWALRRFAPTRPRLAGFASGALAGAVAAVLYAIHCDETAAAFVATWYSIGILLPAIVGLIIGPRILHW